MVQHRTYLKVADNSGAKALMVIQPLGGSGKRKAKAGELVIGVVKALIRTVRLKTVRL